ncbi:hypothetical protein ACLQ3K_24920 [Tsukamurella sp. DT100]|uniref:hypothetical protein n=1 Tax=Tsukamurella sp. DT100 TaxID=3393415 RepID=UPI003CF665F2
MGGQTANDFTRPVELKCILDPASTMKRMIPLAVIFGFAVAILVALVLGLAFPSVGAVSAIGALVAWIGSATLMYSMKRAQLTHTYSEKQRLTLTPQGLRKVDGTIAIEMPWSGISRIEVRNSALASGRSVVGGGALGGAANGAIAAANTKIAAGIVGQATITPLQGASRKMLQAHDRSGGSNLRKGQPHQSPNGLIFPAEFEDNWTAGAVGAWLRHYRPDLHI